MRFPKSVLVTFFIVTVLTAVAAPTIYPTGTTIYNPDEAWSGYTVLSLLDTQAVVVINMNGEVVKRWDNFRLGAGGPARILPDGSVIAPQGDNPGQQESTDLVHTGFDDEERWRYNRNEQISIQGETVWSTRQHHDWQRTDFPAGYYSPEYIPSTDPATTLLLTHTTNTHPDLGDKPVKADRLIEISPEGELLWEWNTSDHFGEFGFDDGAVASIQSAIDSARAAHDWMHINSATYVGPNRWYDNGDERFNPQNVIMSSRHSNIMFIVNPGGCW